MTSTQLHFSKAIEKLNKSQKEAVENIEGPLMVLAGPGTGKTEVLATRIGQILTETDMQASNILCLTFSNAGVQSMEKRLSSLLGQTGDEIEVHTYHSFANKILSQKEGEHKLSENGLLTDVQRFMIFEKLFANPDIAGKYFDLKPANKLRLDSLSRLFSLFKQEGITSQSLQATSLHTINNVLPFIEEYLKKDGDLNAEGRKIHQQIVEFTEAVAPMYDAYLNFLKERNKYEFDDMLQEAVNILNENESLLFHYREKYQYILVDEFQDTNRKQLNLLEVLVKDVEQPNLFIVGDDDQCVYKFQGANTENFNWIQQVIPDMKVILLDTNYRSSEAILKSSFAVINKNEERHALKLAPLKSGAAFDVATNIPVVKSFVNEDQEAFGIATEINNMIHNEDYDKNIAVLFRKNKDAATIKKWLNYYKIHFVLNQSNENLLNTNFGKRIYYILQFIRLYERNNDSAAMYYSKLMMESGFTESLLHTFLLYKKESSRDVNFLQWILSKETNADYVIVRAHLQSLLQLHSLADATISTDFKESLIAIVSNGLETDKNISASWEGFLSEFEITDKFKTPRTLANLILYYKLNQLYIPLEKSNANKNGVILSTIHASKGLEYDTVFVKGCQNKNWEDTGNSRNGISVPKLLNQFIKQDSDETEDIRRVFYVALTRAKTKLNVSYCLDETLKYPSRASVLLAPLFENAHAHIENIAEIELPSLQNEILPVQANEKLMSLIKERVAAFAISTSSTHNWIQCQNKFFFMNICKLSDEGNEAMSFGSLVHEVLEFIAGDISIQYSKEKIEQLVEKIFLKFRHDFHPLHENGYKQAAKFVIRNYLNETPFTKKPDEVEKYLTFKMDNGVAISGMLDRLEFHGDTAKTIDYKSGKYYANNEIFQSDLEIGSPYWRQGMMYHYLINGVYGKKYNIDFAFHYVEEKEEKNKIKVFKYEENKGYEDWLLKIWNQIKEVKFNRSCEDEKCVYCRERLGEN